MSKLQKKPAAHKRGHLTLQNMNFFYFCVSFLPSWIRIRILNTDPDPDPLARLKTDPIRIRIRNPVREGNMTYHAGHVDVRLLEENPEVPVQLFPIRGLFSITARALRPSHKFYIITPGRTLNTYLAFQADPQTPKINKECHNQQNPILQKGVDTYYSIALCCGSAWNLLLKSGSGFGSSIVSVHASNMRLYGSSMNLLGSIMSIHSSRLLNRSGTGFSH
jgi:hypothetical protein